MFPDSAKILLSIAGGFITGLFALLFWIIRVFVEYVNNNKTEQTKQNAEFYTKINDHALKLTSLQERLTNHVDNCHEKHAKK